MSGRFLCGDVEMSVPCLAITHVPRRYRDLCERAGHEFTVVEQFDAAGRGEAILKGSGFDSIHPSTTDGAVGCMLAHVAAWRYIKHLSCEFALVAEDDWIPPERWKEHLAQIVSAAPKEADVLMLTKHCRSIWCDDRDAAVGSKVRVNDTYVLKECLPVYGTGCMLIRPSSAAKLLDNLRCGRHLIPSDVLCWMSTATEEQLEDAFECNVAYHNSFKNHAKTMRSHPLFQTTKTWVVQRPRKLEALWNGKYQIAQFGQTPVSVHSTTEPPSYCLQKSTAKRSRLRCETARRVSIRANPVVRPAVNLWPSQSLSAKEGSHRQPLDSGNRISSAPSESMREMQSVAQTDGSEHVARVRQGERPVTTYE